MKLQTKILLKKGDPQIDYQSRILLMGSCFVENIGEKFGYYQFQNLQNPFGILFQPKAIEKIILRVVKDKIYKETDLFFHNERWKSFDVHSNLWHSEKKQLLSDLNKRLQHTKKQLQKATHIVLTLGTSWAYRYLKTNELVANCHKVPQSEFSKELLSVDEIVQSISNIRAAVRSLNEEAVLLFTISPVRHLKDGFIENQLSKSRLITALHHSLKAEKEFYFPAYEIMMDELRDYRFYASDMIHPNETAIDYIWERFIEVWVRADALPIMEKVNEIQKGLGHTPFNPSSTEHRNFTKALEQKIAYLQNAYPFMEFGQK
ncbi:MAG: GSCFA domain-containing protein [Muriicola sp.]|nr:GSCFA domain-containing protein [Muriicola sp.]